MEHQPIEPTEITPLKTYWRQLHEWMHRVEPCVESRCFETAIEQLQIGEITEAIRCLAGGVYDIGYADEEIEAFVAELEDICERLQTVAPFVFCGEAIEVFRRNARRM